MLSSALAELSNHLPENATRTVRGQEEFYNNPKNVFQFNSCRHVGSKSSPAVPLKALIYQASLHVFMPDDWLLSDPNPALERF